MFNLKQIFFFILAINCLFVIAFFISVNNNNDRFTSSTDFLVHKNASTESDLSTVFTSSEPASDHSQDTINEIKSLREEIRQLTHRLEENNFGADSAPVEKPKAAEKPAESKPLTQVEKDRVADILNTTQILIEDAKKETGKLLRRRNNVQHTLRWNNPFFLLGAYPRITNKYFNSYPDGRPYYEKFNYGVINDPDYCELVDSYNLAHPENMFEQMNFFTDYAKNGLVRVDVIRKLGKDTMKQVSKYMDKSVFKTAQFHLDPTITNYFTKRVDIHIYHMIGKHFNCATQMYNHIPGHGTLKRKDLIVNSVDQYAQTYEDQGLGKCFNKKIFFPYSYRLYLKDECHQFFDKINSAEYKASLKKEPIQYLIKLGYGAHRAQGVFLLDRNETKEINEEYDFGNKCGRINDSVIAQTYVTNPLLLDKNNKFDFRVYMLVASTNPLMVYYHDGFLRVSLETYSKNSEDRNVHLTNTHLSKDTFAAVEKVNKTKAQELRDYQMWNFQRLEDYLYESNKITDRNWVDNYLRPAFKKAFIHTTRMSAYAFWNQSNVYEMFGLDFMLDDELNLWFIECNSSPQLIGTNEHKTKFLIKMLTDLFEIEYGLYRSRMRRVLNLLHKINGDGITSGYIDYNEYKEEYKEAVKNRFEEEYRPSRNNGFELIMDMNLEGPDAYFGNISDDCAN